MSAFDPSVVAADKVLAEPRPDRRRWRDMRDDTGDRMRQGAVSEVPGRPGAFMCISNPGGVGHLVSIDTGAILFDYQVRSREPRKLADSVESWLCDHLYTRIAELGGAQ